MRWNYKCNKILSSTVHTVLIDPLYFLLELSWEYSHYRKGGGFEKINGRPLFTDGFFCAVKRAWRDRGDR